MALLEADNQRLQKILADHRQAAAAAADHTHRTEIERAVTRLRALDFQHPVVYREIPRADLPNILRQKLAQQVPDQEFGDTSVSLAALGLLPAGLDLKKTYLDLLGEQIGAFYDQHSAEVFTFSGQSLDNSQNRVILAHELTHALEDQNFQLARLPLEAKGNDDQALAATALVEGDATLVMSRYMLGDFSASTLTESLAGAFSTDVRQLAAAPRFLRESLLFPYLRGQEFCTALYAHGGWSALAEAFRHPPASTAEILHPERFLARGGEPPPVLVLPPRTLFGRMPIGNNVLGEFGTRQFLAKWLRDAATASQVAAGWRADRYLVYGDARASSYVWKSVWSSPESAAAFAEAAVRCWGARYRLDAKTSGFDVRAPEWNATLPGGRRLVAACRAEEVLLIEAQDRPWEEALRGLPAVENAPDSLHDGHLH